MSAASMPLRIGYCLSLTGPLAENSRCARLAHEIWREDVNNRGGLLGRLVEFVCYDDYSDTATVDGIYKRLMDEDQVDLVIGGYGTKILMAAMPVIIHRERFFVGLMGLRVNEAFGYPNYFAMIPTGPDANAALTEGFFELAAAHAPTSRRIALVYADAEFSRSAIHGAKANAEKYGFNIVHEATYPMATETFMPIIDAAAENNCELLFLSSYPADTVGLVRAINGHRFKPKMVGGTMIGPQSSSVRITLGSQLNGFVNYAYWAPVPSMMFPGISKLMNAYQMKAATMGVDPLGHYVAPLAYAQMQVVGQAIEETDALDDTLLSTFASEATFHTVMGDLRFGKNGEWARPRVLQVQFRGIAGNDINQLRDGSRQVVVSPSRLASGQLIYPFEDARHADPGSPALLPFNEIPASSKPN
ncbi:amino acid ABC transporter substrate-binding protein [Agrobacterium sp. B1(2019)]|uniref:amino acid ABC transporter substrate-binding protein n=1 Tax=Agrobacterium sp. B1(2019) TaxID=2607032 RepID=UPI0011F08E0A|nr:ABC transporter substrate-binding protein [Agrobacterium sp. B1(2019)]